MTRFRAGLLALLLLAIPGVSLAVQPDEMLKDPKLEARARHISEGLRCLVCQNESIDDSDAALAHDLRVLVRKRILAGDTDAQVRQYLVDRYGDYVLLKPPFKATTLVLWLGPGALVLFGAGLAFMFYRNRPTNEPSPLSPEEQRRIKSLVDAPQDKGNDAS